MTCPSGPDVAVGMPLRRSRASASSPLSPVDSVVCTRSGSYSALSANEVPVSRWQYVQ
ncbi:hypothetical protein CGMCC3_g11604 [Colletotrichum fructicola]|nr:uncharacterized protein CGMCC3_g11604 [Colletotrichum fructicola]KAE9572271.1 hypothetical protein CGMCC3_g11604 [Colletotrichum fructicola]